MNFERFPSLITWSSKQSDLLDIAGEWVVSANMCFMTDGHDVEICSRNQKVPQSQYDKFYRCTELVQQLRDPILKLFRKTPNVIQLRVYGEIYGGYYPQQETKAIPKLKPVQQEILYSNKVNFRAFKIKADDKWLSKTATILLCESVGIECAPILFRGSGRDAFQYSQDHLWDKTSIPQLDGELPLDWTPNIREGHVLEPDIVGEKHIMIKHKNKEFEEYKMGRIAEPKSQRSARSDLSSIVEEARCMMTKQRLVNVMSHDIPKTNWKAYLGEMTKDIMQELRHELNEKDTATLRKLITQRIVYPELQSLFDEVNNPYTDLPALIDDDDNEVEEDVFPVGPSNNGLSEPVSHKSDKGEASDPDSPPSLNDTKYMEKWFTGDNVSIAKWLQGQRFVEQKELDSDEETHESDVQRETQNDTDDKQRDEDETRCDKLPNWYSIVPSRGMMKRVQFANERHSGDETDGTPGLVSGDPPNCASMPDDPTRDLVFHEPDVKEEDDALPPLEEDLDELPPLEEDEAAGTISCSDFMALVDDSLSTPTTSTFDSIDRVCDYAD